MATPERTEKLQAMWTRLMGDYSVSPAEAYSVFDHLDAAYREPHRHYHTFDHLYDIFRVVGRLSSGLSDPGAVQLAVWFHDVVYDPKRDDNEDRSTEQMVEWLAPFGMPDATLAAAARLVRATTHRDCPVEADEVVLVDADLAILGAAEYRYREYAGAIRREYDWVSDGDYRAGRTRILERFLARDTVFTHPVMIAEGESAARQNLTTEIAMLGDTSHAL